MLEEEEAALAARLPAALEVRGVLRPVNSLTAGVTSRWLLAAAQAVSHRLRFVGLQARVPHSPLHWPVRCGCSVLILSSPHFRFGWWWQERWADSVCLFHAIHGTTPSAAEFSRFPSAYDPAPPERSAPPVHDEAPLGGWRDRFDEAVYDMALRRFERDLGAYTTCPRERASISPLLHAEA